MKLSLTKQIQILPSIPELPSTSKSLAYRRSEIETNVKLRMSQYDTHLIGWQVKLIKASVCCRQSVGGSVVSVNLEFLSPIHPLQSPKAL